MRVAVIGAGVSGIAAGKTLKQLGHDVVLYEKGDGPGGVWTQAYPGVHLQNMRELYALSDYPWPFDSDDFPPAADVLRYVESAVAHFGLDIRPRHDLAGMVELAGGGWRLDFATPGGTETADTDFVVVAIGHYTHQKVEIDLPGRERFGGRIVTEHDIGRPDLLDGRRVAVVGLGKSAVDVASFAVGRAKEIHHIFREARWLMPRRMLGQYVSRMATERLSTAFARSWVYPHRFQQLTHRHNPSAARINDAMVSYMIRRQLGLRGGPRDKAARARLSTLDPAYGMTGQFRGTLAPENYFPAVAKGDIVPHRATLAGLNEAGVVLSDGSTVAIDTLVLSLGYQRPTMPFLPEPLRREFSESPDGVQLYRHIVHPRVRRLGFAGFNHNPLHILSAELAALWIDAVECGDLALPSAEEMEAHTARIAEWKRSNIISEGGTRAYWVGAHMHNYIDVVMMELGLRHRRKANPLSEWLGHYTAADFAGMVEEYKAKRGTKRAALPFDT